MHFYWSYADSNPKFQSSNFSYHIAIWGFVNAMKTSYEGQSYKEIMLILLIDVLVPKGKFRETLTYVSRNVVMTFGQQIAYAIG